jgi:FMN-dependent NADH-azoreductase
MTQEIGQMATLLHISSSIFGTDGQSSQLADRYLQQWKAAHPAGNVVVRDVVADAVPHLDGARAGAFFTPEEARTEEQQSFVDYSDALIEELRQADEVVIGLPLYNFSIPSQLKAYFDQLARAGVTFKYTENGPVGLLDNKPVHLLATRGGIYKGSDADTSIPFVTQFLGFIGLTDVNVIYAEGLSMAEQKDASLSQARAEVDAILSAV